MASSTSPLDGLLAGLRLSLSRFLRQVHGAPEPERDPASDDQLLLNVADWNGLAALVSRRRVAGLFLHGIEGRPALGRSAAGHDPASSRPSSPSCRRERPVLGSEGSAAEPAAVRTWHETRRSFRMCKLGSGKRVWSAHLLPWCCCAVGHFIWMFPFSRPRGPRRAVVGPRGLPNGLRQVGSGPARAAWRRRPGSRRAQCC